MPNANVTAFRESGIANNSFYKSSDTMQGSYGIGFNSLGNPASKSLKFDASRSSFIYGKSSTVQPATCKCYFVIKY